MRTRAALLAIFAGCATVSHSQPHEQGSSEYSRESGGAVARWTGVTVAVTNETASGAVTIRENGPTGRRLYSQLMPGQTACLLLTGSVSRRLYAETIGGGIHGPQRYTSDAISMTERPAWRWTLNGAPGNGFFIQAEAQCGGKDASLNATGWSLGGGGDNTAGFTMWVCGDTAPHSWVRADLLETPEATITAAHEAVHAADLAALGSCQAAEAASRDPVFHLASEARAYCASARVASVLLGGSLDRWIVLSAYTLANPRNYPTFAVTPARAEQLIRLTCGPPGTVWTPGVPAGKV